ncbi:MAG: FtsW/RodA/SpoVE family cell cycle protein [Bacillota bacterium]|nr:FtsW/RodA/SpoVE family cell cycle protein [Bacillota bacterium]MDW7684802.1 FtsW/RodA/SpoVE family cell cycle protein [Bacillota bacterium]
MPQSSKINDYLTVVCEQIRWQKAHDIIAGEIKDHIIDQKDFFVTEGLDEETATEKAIFEMGDPVLVGGELDRTHRPKVEWSIIIFTGIALALRFIIQIAITSDIYVPGGLAKSLMYTMFGIVIMTAAYYIDFTIIGKYPMTVFSGFIILTLGAAFISPTINGYRIYIPFLLLLFPTVFAGIIYSMRSKGYLGIVLSGILTLVPVPLGMLATRITGIAPSVICLILMTLAIVKGWFHVKNKVLAALLTYIPAALAAMYFLFFLVVKAPYAMQRILCSLNPSLDPMNHGYMGTVIRDLLQGARFFGEGKMSVPLPVEKVLPEIHSDTLLTYLIHRFGWISFIVIFVVVTIFIVRAFVICSRQKSILGTLVAVSVLLAFTMQVVLFFIFNLGLPVVSMVALPLVSFNGTATIINMLLIGILLSVFKSGDIVRDKLIISSSRKNKRLEFTEGKIIINLN